MPAASNFVEDALSHPMAVLPATVYTFFASLYGPSLASSNLPSPPSVGVCSAASVAPLSMVTVAQPQLLLAISNLAAFAVAQKLCLDVLSIC
jgi:hypothetical protein